MVAIRPGRLQADAVRRALGDRFQYQIHNPELPHPEVLSRSESLEGWRRSVTLADNLRGPDFVRAPQDEGGAI